MNMGKYRNVRAQKDKKKKIIRIIIVIIIPGMFCIFFSLSCRGFREQDGVVGGREGGVWRTEIKTGLVGRQRRVEDGRMYVQAFKVPVGLIGVKRNQAASMMKALRGSEPGLQHPLRTHRVTRRPSLCFWLTPLIFILLFCVCDFAL